MTPSQMRRIPSYAVANASQICEGVARAGGWVIAMHMRRNCDAGAILMNPCHQYQASRVIVKPGSTFPVRGSCGCRLLRFWARRPSLCRAQHTIQSAASKLVLLIMLMASQNSAADLAASAMLAGRHATSSATRDWPCSGCMLSFR